MDVECPQKIAIEYRNITLFNEGYTQLVKKNVDKKLEI